MDLHHYRQLFVKRDSPVLLVCRSSFLLTLSHMPEPFRACLPTQALSPDVDSDHHGTFTSLAANYHTGLDDH